MTYRPAARAPLVGAPAARAEPGAHLDFGSPFRIAPSRALVFPICVFFSRTSAPFESEDPTNVIRLMSGGGLPAPQPPRALLRGAHLCRLRSSLCVQPALPPRVGRGFYQPGAWCWR
jgi:hypothetical protein